MTSAMGTPNSSCAGLDCYARCQNLHSLAMASVMGDYIIRAEGGDRAASAQRRNIAWERWEEFERTHCPQAQNIEPWRG